MSMWTRLLDRLEDFMAGVGDPRRWFLIGLAIPAVVVAWWTLR